MKCQKEEKSERTELSELNERASEEQSGKKDEQTEVNKKK